MSKKRNFNVGDQVWLRTWEDLKNEYGTDSDGDIEIKGFYHFRSAKSHYGKQATVKNVIEGKIRTTLRVLVDECLLDVVKECISDTLPEEPRKEYEFKVGDIVRVRDWEYFKSNYELDANDEFKVDGVYFQAGMKCLCGCKAEISSIANPTAKCYILTGIDKKDSHWGWWYFSAGMLELCEPRKKGRDLNFKVGEKVRIRQWDDMAAQFKADGRCVRTPNYLFTDDMKEYSGRICTIKEIEEWEGDESPNEGYDVYFEEHLGGFRWTFGMIEKIDEQPVPEVPVPKSLDERRLEKFSSLKEGDVVKIRTWEEMEAEYGLDGGGDIVNRKAESNGNFSEVNQSKRHVCGTYVTVDDIDEDDNSFRIKGIDRWLGYWTIDLEDEAQPVPEGEMKEAPRYEVFTEGEWGCAENASERCCANCSNMKELDGGYCWCKDWHNTTVPNGFCHKFI